jgi:hypothetical protein
LPDHAQPRLSVGLFLLWEIFSWCNAIRHGLPGLIQGTLAICSGGKSLEASRNQVSAFPYWTPRERCYWTRLAPHTTHVSSWFIPDALVVVRPQWISPFNPFNPNPLSSWCLVGYTLPDPVNWILPASTCINVIVLFSGNARSNQSPALGCACMLIPEHMFAPSSFPICGAYFLRSCIAIIALASEVSPFSKRYHM